MATTVEYKKDNVLDAARKRVSLVFDNFENIVVSVSSGKDSSVLCALALKEAEKRNRKVIVFFLDQEAEYQSSIDVVEKMMDHPLVIPAWFQVPLKMTNATSHKDIYLDAWYEGAKWVRPKHEMAIHKADGAPDRFYKFFTWYESTFKEKTAFLVGLRSKESLNRFRSISKNPGFDNISWSTKTSVPHVFRFYPVYDWTFGDIWKYIKDNDVLYNKNYDRMFAKHGVNMTTMRISNLVHEKSFKSLSSLQEFEPHTYDKLVQRVGGIHCAALYSKDKYIYNTDLPKKYTSWKEYRDYLLDTTPEDMRVKFKKRFDNQSDDDRTCKHHVKQILYNDTENNIPVINTWKFDKDKWWSIL